MSDLSLTPSGMKLYDSPPGIDPAAFAAFAQRMRTRESGDQPGPQDDAKSYAKRNRFGFLGAYQFGMARLCDFGFTRRREGTAPDDMNNAAFEWVEDWNEYRFIAHRRTQDRIFAAHVHNHLRWIRRRKYERFVGEMTSALLEGELDPADDSVVSLSGMMAVCHLVGRRGLIKLLEKAIDKHDGNHTRASTYMKTLGGYF